MKLEDWMMDDENWETPEIKPIRAKVHNWKNAEKSKRDKERMKKRVRKYRNKRKLE